ncbi:MAG: hypothetical protein ABSA26_07980 [Thermoguttaceae bacterium]|jgi:hypothetical protein
MKTFLWHRLPNGPATAAMMCGAVPRVVRFAVGVLAAVAATVILAVQTDAQTQPSGRIGPGLPAAVDLRPEFARLRLEPRSQGDRNTCSVFTTTWAMEFAVSEHSGKGCPLSVEYINWACNQVINNHTEDRGQFFEDLLKGYQLYGICTERLMPYQGRFDPKLGPSPEAIHSARAIKALGLKITWYKPLDDMKLHLTDQQLLRIKEILAKGWPVAAGSFHSRLLVGYRDDAILPGGGVFITKDSGLGGYGEISYEWAKANVGNGFWVETGVPQTRVEVLRGSKPGMAPRGKANEMLRIEQPPALRTDCFYYLKHEFSGKFVCTGATKNGEFVHLWGPIPEGDADRYMFKLVASGEKDYYYLIHKHSGKYICTGDTTNGAKIHLWGPIPPGQEDYYKFKLIASADHASYFLVHKHSGKYLCSGFLENAGEVYVWGPIPAGSEDHCQFRLTRAE